MIASLPQTNCRWPAQLNCTAGVLAAWAYNEWSAAMRVLPAITLFSLSFSIARPSLAATVVTDRGEVLVNRGAGFKAIKALTLAGPGDLVMVDPRGSGRITFEEGCTFKIKPGEVYVIPEKSPCTPVGGQLSTSASSSDPLPEHTEQFDHRRFAVGAAIAVGAIVGGVLLLRADDKPASP